MWWKGLLLSCLFHGMCCLVFKSSGKLDYLDAVEYCKRMNSSLAAFDEAVTARNRCMLYDQNVWYIRQEGSPKHDKKEGNCYVHGSYWIPCRDKAWFFCDDGSDDEMKIQCEANEANLGFYGDLNTDKENGVTGTKPFKDDSGPKEINMALSMFEWLVVAGIVLCCSVCTFAVTFVLVKRHFAKEMTLEQQYVSMEPTRTGRTFSAIDSKWYEETVTKEIHNVNHVKFGRATPTGKPLLPPDPSHIYDETGKKPEADVKMFSEPPHVYDRADKIKLKSQTMPVRRSENAYSLTYEPTNTLPDLDAVSPLPPTYEEADGRQNYMRSLSEPSSHYEATRNTTFLEHQYSETAKKTLATDVGESPSKVYATPITYRPALELPKPYETIYRQWEVEEKRINEED